MKLLVTTALFFTFALLGVGCNFQLGTPKVDEVKIEKIELAANNDGKPGAPVISFKAGDTRQYFLISFNGGKKGTQIRGTFIAVEAGEIRNQQIAQAEVTTEDDSQASANFQVDVAAGFPAGNYKAVFTVDGKPGRTVEYKVE